ncbi:MAG: hypothetical protein QNL88_01135 [Acidobacteriota bacterium]|nr:hypothetical protein [Acidobacteriota bacterium]
MRGFRTFLIAVILLGFAGIAGAVGPMTLARTGDLYSVSTIDNQVVVTARYADGTVSELFVPQSSAAVDDSLQVGVDQATGALYVMWQKKTDMEARLRLAGYLDGTWIGPVTFAGNDGTAASNPQMILHRVVSTYFEEAEGEEEPAEIEIATTFLHLTWWNRANEDDIGSAQYQAVRIDEDGTPMFRETEPMSLVDFLPYGIACFDIGPAENLKHPKLLMDPRSGNPHVFATDLNSCLFQMFELQSELVEDIATKRRRHIIILRSPSTVALRPDLPLEATKIEVGSGLKLIMHWDGDDETLEYLELDKDGLSETKSLSLDETLSHEQAVELIRGLRN